jgi:hypothetical protein
LSAALALRHATILALATIHAHATAACHVSPASPRHAPLTPRLQYCCYTRCKHSAIFAETSRETSPRRPLLRSALLCLARGPAALLLFPTHHPAYSLAISLFPLPGPACVLHGCHSYPPTHLPRSGLLETVFVNFWIQLTKSVMRISIDAAGSSPRASRGHPTPRQYARLTRSLREGSRRGVLRTAQCGVGVIVGSRRRGSGRRWWSAANLTGRSAFSLQLGEARATLLPMLGVADAAWPASKAPFEGLHDG